MFMIREQLMTTIKMAHRYGNGFTREQVYQFLPIKMDRYRFNSMVDALVSTQQLREVQSILLAENVYNSHFRHQLLSRGIFDAYKIYLKVFAHLPWVRFMALTGSNAFESCCHEEDDIDLFVVTAGDRLWITYLWMVLLSKLTNKRKYLCLNYLVDEDHLTVYPHNYFAAVQLLQMRPLFNAHYKEKLIAKNSWIFNELPNMTTQSNTEPFYRLKNDDPIKKIRFHNPMRHINRYIFKTYARRLQKKYTSLIGNSIILRKGEAKLHRVDYSRSYDNHVNTLKRKVV
ncbi:MAG: hypothetical protein GF313_03275 [Caldithrix sp.]|nr:hypothetical protein [Caldithrix sp.]